MTGRDTIGERNHDARSIRRREFCPTPLGLWIGTDQRIPGLRCAPTWAIGSRPLGAFEPPKRASLLLSPVSTRCQPVDRDPFSRPKAPNGGDHSGQRALPLRRGRRGPVNRQQRLSRRVPLDVCRQRAGAIRQRSAGLPRPSAVASGNSTSSANARRRNSTTFFRSSRKSSRAWTPRTTSPGSSEPTCPVPRLSLLSGALSRANYAAIVCDPRAERARNDSQLGCADA